MVNVHTQCLQRWITTRPNNNNRANERGGLNTTGVTYGDTRLVCELCKTEYQIDFCYHIQWTRATCCRWQSIGHALELAILLVLLLLSIAFFLVMVLGAFPAHEEFAFGNRGADRTIIPVVALAVMGAAFVAVFRVWKRLERANSLVVIAPNNHTAAAAAATSSSYDESEAKLLHG
jgi:hypothetical protein